MSAAPPPDKVARVYWPELDAIVAGEIVRRLEDGKVTIRYAGSIEITGHPLSLEDILKIEEEDNG